MTLEILQIVAIAAAVLAVFAIVAAVFALRANRKPASSVLSKLETQVAGLRTDIESLRDRSRMIEERFDRFDRTQVELRDAQAKLREDFDSRLARVRSQDAADKALQEQIYEIRKEHQVLMERGDRHDRRVTELQSQLNEVSRTTASRREDGLATKTSASERDVI